MLTVYVVHGRTVVWPVGATCPPKKTQLEIVKDKKGGYYKIWGVKPSRGYQGEVQAQTCDCEGLDWSSKVYVLVEAVRQAAKKLLPAGTKEVWVELVD